MLAQFKFKQCLYYAVIFIGIALGTWWVIAPMIAMKHAGRKTFGPLWGVILTFNYFGILLAGLLFTFIWDNTSKPLYLIYILFIGGCILAAGLTFISQRLI